MEQDLTTELRDRVRAAAVDARPLALVGHGTKSFLGRALDAEAIALSAHAGILNYQPKELVITARSGTPLAEIESVLAEAGQMLAFEPPHFARSADAGATLGGTIAAGLSGPARPYLGSARDLVLGVRVLTGGGEVLRFGGEVMKNVAGYDVSRLMVGALGTLGILLDVSLKVLPAPSATQTQVLDCGEADALRLMGEWAAKPLPVTATCFDGEHLWVRLSGAAQGVREALERIGGDAVEPDPAKHLWHHLLREQQHGFFAGDVPLWRLSMPQAAPRPALDGVMLVEWGGGQRWLRSEDAPEKVREAVAKLGGHATLFRGGDRFGEVFHPLPVHMMQLHRRVKTAFDPHGILNPGRLYAGL
ncbi:glycolate oxidase subunit GlcE [Thiorhodococcus minor]|uniref:glycolate oxidase subunit GlcE n=1 Tax=Thiorhodococcus minor TaxID=57489 RepID=UPI0031587662